MKLGWPALTAFLLLFATNSFAADRKLKLEISSEGDWIPYEEPSAVASAGVGDRPESPYFYVVLSSDSDVPVTLNATKGNWWEALSFVITLADGRQFPITRPARNRLNNYTEQWILEKGRCRVFVVNLKTGDWQGLPKLGDLPDRKPMTLQAFFRLRGMNSDVKAQSQPVELRP